VTNQQPTPASNVTVVTSLYAGNHTDGDVLWQRTEQVGTLEPSESYTANRRVELTLEEALSIREADGWVTIRTTVDSAGRTADFTDREQVI